MGHVRHGGKMSQGRQATLSHKLYSNNFPKIEATTIKDQKQFFWMIPV